MKNLKKIEKIAIDGYNIDFGRVFEESFENFKKIFGVAGLGMILISIVVAAIVIGGVMALSGIGDISDSLAGFNVKAFSGVTLLYFILFGIIFAMIMNILSAGFINMAHLADNNKEFGLSNLFDYFKGIYFKDLLISSFIIAAISTVGSTLIQNFSNEFLSNIFSYFISYITFLTVPLIIFSKLDAVNAIVFSIKLVFKQPIILFLLLLVGYICAMLGFIALCIGIFFTLPFIYSLYYCIYKNIIPVEEYSELDEIGRTTE